jgi:hypothetical protein
LPTHPFNLIISLPRFVEEAWPKEARLIKRFRIALALAVVAVAFAVFAEALKLMNQPSTLLLVLGIAILLGLFVTVPTVFALLWRRKNDHVRQVH